MSFLRKQQSRKQLDSRFRGNDIQGGNHRARQACPSKGIFIRLKCYEVLMKGSRVKHRLFKGDALRYPFGEQILRERGG